MACDLHRITLQKELDEDIHNAVKVYLKELPQNRESVILSLLYKYIKLLSGPINKRNKELINYNLILMRAHICQSYKFHTARVYFSYTLHLMSHLTEKALYSGDQILPSNIETEADYNIYRAYIITDVVFGNIATTTAENFERALTKCCSQKIATKIREYTKTLKEGDRNRLKYQLIIFLKEIYSKDKRWYRKPRLIESELARCNTELNLQPIKPHPTARSLYMAIFRVLSELQDKGYVPATAVLLKYIPRNNGRAFFCQKKGTDRDKLSTATLLNKICENSPQHLHKPICTFIKSLTNIRNQKDVSETIHCYLNVLLPSFKKRPTKEARTQLLAVMTNLCGRYKYSVAKLRINALLNLLNYLEDRDLIIQQYQLPSKIGREDDYERLKQTKTPNNILMIMPRMLTAEEIFEATIERCCNLNIASRLNEHVNSFKKENRKSHRSPLVIFLNEIYSKDKAWHKKPKIIQGTLLNFRDGLLGRHTRAYAYRCFQNVKNAISLLIEHGLIPCDTYLPKNVTWKQPASLTNKSAPIIIRTPLYVDSKSIASLNSEEFIENIKIELFEGLQALVKVSQLIVHAEYKQFRNQTQAHHTQEPPERETDAASKVKPLSRDERSSYFDKNFERIIRSEHTSKVNGAMFGRDISCRFGLTPLIASAMQIIITEELGFNPHSLYLAKTHCDRRGNEYIQVCNDGCVTMKSIKYRSRRSRTVTAKGNNTPTGLLDAHQIDAAACLKIAMEIGERTRRSLQSNYLWLCLSKNGVARVCDPATFQRYFNYIRNKASEEHAIEYLRSATLKKIRASKGVLIYLESNGNTLKATEYMGNHVETALKNYIPDHLSELIYRVKIRSFQNILLYMSLSNNDNFEESLAIQRKDLQERLCHAFRNPDMGGPLYQKLTQPTREVDNQTKYFCLSKESIIQAIEYIKNGEDKNLRKDCETVIKKLSEGPVVMKQMLRSALKYSEGK